MRVIGERVAIVGSREWGDINAVRAFVASLPPETIVVSGGARGVDTIAEHEANARGLLTYIILPNRNEHGKRAEYLRNVQIVDNSDRIVAFWDGKSRGTKHTIDIATRSGKPVEVYRG